MYRLKEGATGFLDSLRESFELETMIARAEHFGIPQEAVRNFLEALQSADLLEKTSDTAQSVAYSKIFSGWRSQRGMLMDSARTLGFKHAIDAVVKQGDTVVDVGSGSGILSFFSALAGASKVHGLEITSMAEEATQLARQNGLADRVEFIQGDAGEYSPTGKIDVLLGEWVGYYLIEEWKHFQAFARLRDQNLSSGGAVMPRGVKLYLCPVEDSRLYMERGHGYWEEPVYGLDFKYAGESQYSNPKRVLVQADRKSLLGIHQILDMDCQTAQASDMFFECAFETAISRPARCHGYVGYFELDLGGGVILDTSPFSLQTCWHQSYFPTRSFALEPGDVLKTSVKTHLVNELTAVSIGHSVLRQGVTIDQGRNVFLLD